MAMFFTGALALALLYLGAQAFARANPKNLAVSLRPIAGTALCASALVLILSGRYAVLALPVFLAALALFAGMKWPFRRRPHVFSRPSGHGSRVKTGFFDMELSHATGKIDGLVLAGGLAGRRLSSLDRQELATLYAEVAEAQPLDRDSLSLIETYLDGVISGWREDFHANHDAGHGGAAGSRTVTEQEAYEVLGLQPGADAAAIRAAHRRLILKLHPDRGGTTALAAKINEAKDILLRNHSSTS